MKMRSIAFVSIAAVLLTYGSFAWDKPPKKHKPTPQFSVECTGWHALCSLATDCKMTSPQQADCACWQVQEQHIIVTTNIKDETFGGAPIKEETQRRCTTVHPCAVDEAPVCQAIKDLLEDKQWVSTYSYRGWCENWDPVKCEGKNAGLWADCMTSPCTVMEDPSDPNRPLSCQCTVNDGGFVGTNGTCDDGDQDTVMSTIPRLTWDFDNNEFSFSMPGYHAYVKGACAPVESDHPLADE
jgi:hypothetical protein